MLKGALLGDGTRVEAEEAEENPATFDFVAHDIARRVEAGHVVGKRWTAHEDAGETTSVDGRQLSDLLTREPAVAVEHWIDLQSGRSTNAIEPPQDLASGEFGDLGPMENAEVRPMYPEYPRPGEPIRTHRLEWSAG